MASPPLGQPGRLPPPPGRARRGPAGRRLAGAVPLWVLTSHTVGVVVASVSTGDQCDSRPVQAECSGHADIEEHIKAVTDPSIYKRLVRPPCGNSTHAGPTKVEVQFRLLQVNDINEKLGHVTVNGYLRTWWKDPRLAFNDTANGGCFSRIDLPGSMGDMVWVPDLYFDNLVKLDTDTGGARLTSIAPDGTVWSSIQTLVTVKVDFELGKLPYDDHTIRMTVASYSQDSSSLRVLARGGSVGAGSSGLALTAPVIKHAVWDFFGSLEQTENEYETRGVVEDSFGWDYLSIMFHIKRRPKYYIDQVIYPCTVFILISYSQFYVDAHAAPARATLAVIPVLIMRTMVNYVYRNLPEGSQHMWLADFLFVANLLVGLGAVEYALVQYCLTLETKRAKRREGLQKVTGTASKLMKQSLAEGCTLMELVYSVTQKSMPSKSNMSCGRGVFGAGFPKQVRPVSPQALPSNEHLRPFSSSKLDNRVATQWQDDVKPANQEDDDEESQHRRSSFTAVIKECDLTFVFFALDVFDDYPGGTENRMTVYEFRRALVTFDIYMNLDQAARALGMAMRDMGEETADDELTITLSFEKFTRVLLVIDSYSWASRDRRRKYRLTPHALLMSFQSRCPSKCIDTIARWVCPVIVLLFYFCFYALLPTWDGKND